MRLRLEDNFEFWELLLFLMEETYLKVERIPLKEREKWKKDERERT